VNCDSYALTFVSFDKIKIQKIDYILVKPLFYQEPNKLIWQWNFFLSLNLFYGCKIEIQNSD